MTSDNEAVYNLDDEFWRDWIDWQEHQEQKLVDRETELQALSEIIAHVGPRMKVCFPDLWLLLWLREETCRIAR